MAVSRLVGGRRVWPAVALLVFTVGATRAGAAAEAPAPTPGVGAWDTRDTVGTTAAPTHRASWRALPEGRATVPAGDVVLQGGPATLVLQARAGKVLLFSTGGARRAFLCPLELKGKPGRISGIRLSREGDESASVAITFTSGGSGSALSASLTLTQKGILTLASGKGVSGFTVAGNLAGAIVPSPLGDDLVYEAGNLPAGPTLYLPSENWLLGLLKGEDGMLVLTWPGRSQQLSGSIEGPPAQRGIGAVDFATDGKPLSLAVIAGQGVWHREALLPNYLERDVASAWQPPFAARWLTQLLEDDIPTTFEFRDGKRDVWRGSIGNYTYPVWLDGWKAMYSLGKKIPPEGASVVYCLERAQSTPPAVLLPADIAQLTLDEATFASVLDADRRKVGSPGRPNYVVGAAACATTDKLQPIFEAGQEVEKADYIREGTEDMIYQSTFLRARADAYQEFGHKMMEYLAGVRQGHPELEAYVADLETTTQRLFAAFDAQKEPMHDAVYARELQRRTVALTTEKRPSNLPDFLKVKADWRGMGGTLEGLNRQLHSITRLLLQQAGYGCAERPTALPVAGEVRARTKAMLAGANYYETWTTY